MEANLSTPGPSQQDRDGVELSELSKALVRLYKAWFGRGPTKASTHHAGPNIIVTTLEESFTPAEQRLVSLGEHQRLREVRLFFQHANEDKFREAVESITGRKVRGFTSGTDTDNDISTEVFHLQPESGSRQDLTG